MIFMNAGDKFVAEFTVENAMRSVRDPKAVYYGDALFVDPTQRRSYIYGGPYSAYTICSTNICHQSIFYPKAAYKNYSYDLKYRLFSDYAYNINLFAKRFKFVYLKDIPITANIWNYYSYLRAKSEYKRLKHEYS